MFENYCKLSSVIINAMSICEKYTHFDSDSEFDCREDFHFNKDIIKTISMGKFAFLKLNIKF